MNADDDRDATKPGCSEDLKADGVGDLRCCKAQDAGSVDDAAEQGMLLRPRL